MAWPDGDFIGDLLRRLRTTPVWLCLRWRGRMLCHHQVLPDETIVL